jgi:glycosyltransferase involved in cell wall biosynthesis
MTPASDPLVSVIIPAYNCQCYIAEAIESALHQTYIPVEVIVLDDDSTDRTLEIARRFSSVHCVSQVHAGAGAARNRGAALARGALLAFLDADDRWPLHKLSRQVEALRHQPNLDMVFGCVQQLHAGTEWEEAIAKPDDSTSQLMPGFVAGTMMIRREAFIRVGEFRTEWKVGEFIDWYGRATDMGLRSMCMPGLLLWRRIHATNQGIVQRASVSDYAKVIKARLDRRRARGSDGI